MTKGREKISFGSEPKRISFNEVMAVAKRLDDGMGTAQDREIFRRFMNQKPQVGELKDKIVPIVKENILGINISDVYFEDEPGHLILESAGFVFSNEDIEHLGNILANNGFKLVGWHVDDGSVYKDKKGRLRLYIKPP